MAVPTTLTPVLEGKEAADFIKTIQMYIIDRSKYGVQSCSKKSRSILELS